MNFQDFRNDHPVRYQLVIVSVVLGVAETLAMVFCPMIENL